VSAGVVNSSDAQPGDEPGGTIEEQQYFLTQVRVKKISVLFNLVID
jgi:hypothetical protein